MGDLHRLAAKFDGEVVFLVVYICEAHPIDGWQISDNVDDGVELASPKSDSERLSVATACALHLQIDLPVVIDPIEDPLADAYGALPDRLYLVDTSGRVAYQGAEGPMGFLPAQLDAAIDALLSA